MSVDKKSVDLQAINIVIYCLSMLYRNTVRKRVELPSYGGGESRKESYDVFADDRSINR